MSITPRVPHDDLIIKHTIEEEPETSKAQYVLRLKEPDGTTTAPPIIFHKGSPEAGWHGWTTAHVIAGLIKHMEYHQSTPFACLQNGEVLFHLRAALEATKARASERKGRGVLYDHENP